MSAFKITVRDGDISPGERGIFWTAKIKPGSFQWHLETEAACVSGAACVAEGDIRVKPGIKGVNGRAGLVIRLDWVKGSE